MAAKSKKAAVSSGTAVDGLVGFDIETGGPFDPLGFGRNCPAEQMQWYRAAELKHGRVCMLAAFGQIAQSYVHWNDPSGVFDQASKPWAAMVQVGKHSLLIGVAGKWSEYFENRSQRRETSKLRLNSVHTASLESVFFFLLNLCC